MEAALLKAAFILAAAGLLFVLTVSPSKILAKIVKIGTEDKTQVKKTL